MAIQKCRFVVEFLFDDQIDPEPQVDSYDLTVIAEEMDSGTLIGVMKDKQISVVSPDQVRDTLLEMGNDGTFFDS